MDLVCLLPLLLACIEVEASRQAWRSSFGLEHYFPSASNPPVGEIGDIADAHNRLKRDHAAQSVESEVQEQFCTSISAIISRLSMEKKPLLLHTNLLVSKWVGLACEGGGADQGALCRGKMHSFSSILLMTL